MAMVERDTNSTEFFKSSTSNYFVLFEGCRIETTITNTAKIVDKWIQKISSSFINDNHKVIIGLDTEWMSDENRKYKVAILQLCIEDKCLIFQLAHMDYIPESLMNFLKNPKYNFVGVEVKNDINMLKNNYGLECENGIDVFVLATTKWPEKYSSIGKLGLKHLAKELVGLKMEKPNEVCTSKWQLNKLTEAQVEYACIDAYVSYKIGKELLVNSEKVPSTRFNGDVHVGTN